LTACKYKDDILLEMEKKITIHNFKCFFWF